MHSLRRNALLILCCLVPGVVVILLGIAAVNMQTSQSTPEHTFQDKLASLGYDAQDMTISQASNEWSATGKISYVAVTVTYHCDITLRFKSPDVIVTQVGNLPDITTALQQFRATSTVNTPALTLQQFLTEHYRAGCP